MSGLTDMGGTRPPSHPASRLAIIAAMPEELDAFLAAMPDETSVELAGRRFSCGHWQGHEVVAVLSGIGKVAASITATALVTHFQATRLIFTGVAGGLGAGVQVGDVVVANELLQHDLDASPIFPRHELPGRGISRIATCPALSHALLAAARQTLAVSGGQQVHEGLIVSGDRFVSSATEAQALQTELPDALAVEMEGAAIAQVCLDFGLPFGVVRSISDRADDTAHVDFARFVREVASPHALAIVQAALQHLPTAP
jgi:adenosylhomocysteine nucleosidase